MTTNQVLRWGGRCGLAALLCVLASACGGGGGGGAGGAPLDFTPAVLPDGTSGDLYATTLFASGGSGGYAWQMIAGVLPPGITGLPASGPTAGLTGVLGAPGAYGFTVRLSDSDGTLVDRLFSVTIAPSGGPGPVDHATSLTNAPTGRSGHTAVWTGNEMIVWGGVQQIGLFGDGGAYDPATDTWRVISSVGAPTPRVGHTAVWTGAEMIVWGGWDAAGPLGTGAAYDPVQDTWRTLATVGAPQARSLHSAVWTGTAMIVWGGQGLFQPPAPNSVDLVFADGASYDPVTNAWSAVAAGGPAARWHSAVWTGTRMITWAGRDSFALTITTINLGGMYDPAANAWTATSVATAPTARIGHTAVWSGLTMVVWGGSGGIAAPVDTGGRFLPGPNTWAGTSVVGAPSARSGHSAIWSGNEMVVWGGSGTGSPLGDGAAYNPVSDTWRTVVPGIIPAPRSGHTAVWTGSAMIVWGGSTTPTDTYLSSGAVIHP